MSITSTCPRDFHFDPAPTPDTVGPGAYELITKKKVKKTIIPFGTTTRRELWNIEDAPHLGPGVYELDYRQKSPKVLSDFSLEATRCYFVDRAQSPSPADHAPIKRWTKKRPTTGNQTRPKSVQRKIMPLSPPVITPGPSDYNVRVDHNGRKTDFSSSHSPQRDPAKYNGIPGPAYYEPETSDVREMDIESPEFKTRAKRKVFDDPIYDSVMLDHQAWMPEIYEGRPFGGNSRREIDWHIPDTPGADVHAFVTQPRTKKQYDPFGAASRDFVKEASPQLKNPGPGYYVDKSSPKAIGGVIGTAQRPDLWKDDVVITPSPNQYEAFEHEMIVGKSVKRTASPAFKDRAERDCLTNKQPNPGPAYLVKMRPKSGLKFQRAQRFTPNTYVGNKKINDAPSPAEYSINDDKTSGGFVGKDVRFHKVKENPKLGPGAYLKVKCEMIKPSKNIMFDKDMKNKKKTRPGR